jgi:hypothetical protein
MTKPADDYEAVRIIVDALDEFQGEDQERIIRWAREKLKLPGTALSSTPSLTTQLPHQPNASALPGAPTSKDLRTFVSEKAPASDVQFAATVAFYYHFDAPPDERKNTITAADLKEACRLVNRKRLNNPLTTLNNARQLGLLDSAGRGLFTLNSVGENLVAMTLPSASENATPRTRPKVMTRPKKNRVNPKSRR